MEKTLITIMTILAVASWICPCPVMAFEASDMNIHGFIAQGLLRSNEYNYLTHNSEDTSLEYNEMGINFSQQLTDKLHAGLQLFARDLGDAANNKVTLDWAYADYRARDWLGLRVGRMKLPIGLYNETRDMDMLRTSIVLPQGIYNDLLRDTLIAMNGVGTYGYVDLMSAGSLNYQLLGGYTTVDRENGVGKAMDSAFAALGGEVPGDSNIDVDTSYIGALTWNTPLEGLKIGYSLFYSPAHIPFTMGGVLETTLDSTFNVQVFSAEYTWNNLVVAAEYMKKIMDGELLGIQIRQPAEAYYLSASYMLNDLFSLGVYYAEYYPDEEDKDGDAYAIDHNAWEKDLALTLRFDLNEYWILKIEGHSIDGTANVISLDNTKNDYSESGWYYVATKMSFSF